MEKIEFYKNRSLSERFSAAAEFIRQNWKMMYKIVLIPAIPLVLLQGYFTQNYLSLMKNVGRLESTHGLLGGVGMYLLVFMALMIILYAVSGAIMSRYEAGLLTKETRWKDLSSKIRANLGKVFLISFITLMIVIFVSFIIGGLVVVSASTALITMLLFIVVLFAIIPALALIYYPALFQGASVWKSVKKGFRFGFKSWGTTFLTILIIGVATVVISYLFQLPYIIWTIFASHSGIVSYLLATLSTCGFVFVTPLTFVFLAFQYFSVVEKEEGISLQAKIEEFDNL